MQDGTVLLIVFDVGTPNSRFITFHNKSQSSPIPLKEYFEVALSDSIFN
ncbi:MAG: hypothetical protein JNN26_20640 [Candidatus Obscuribacter sp.]|nr:hypothetical protein [Candidatus Obscuribacter sp.]